MIISLIIVILVHLRKWVIQSFWRELFNIRLYSIISTNIKYQIKSCTLQIKSFSDILNFILHLTMRLSIALFLSLQQNKMKKIYLNLIIIPQSQILTKVYNIIRMTAELDIQNQTIWPNAIFNHLSLKKTLLANNLKITHHLIQKKAIEYIAYICNTKKYSVSSFQRCLSITAKYLSKTSSNQNIQLILLTSLLLVTKILQTENLTISELHELSNHCFTNRNIHQMEGKICESIQFSMLTDGLPSRKIKIILEMIKHTLPQHSHYYLDSISEDVQVMFWYQFYSKPFDLNIDLTSFDLIPMTIVQISMILMTQSNGSFPQIAWISTILGVKKEKIQQLTSKYLKKMLGKQVSKSLFI